MTPSLETKGIWDSNPLMLQKDAKAIHGSITTAKITFADQTPRTALTLDTWLNENVYNDTAYNSTDYHAAVKIARHNERWRAGLGSEAHYDTLRQSEWGPLGVSSKNARELHYNFTPQISYQNTATMQTGLTANYAQMTSDSDQTRDYETFNISPTVQKTFDPKDSAFFSFNAGRYQTMDDNPVTRSDSLGPSVGWLRQLSSTLSLRVSGGAEYSRDQGYNISNESWKIFAVYSGSLIYTGEQNTVNLTAQRAKQPFDNGSEYYLTSFALNAARHLTPELTFNLGGSYQYADYNVFKGDIFDYRLVENVGLSYQAYKEMSLSMSYKHREDVWTMGNSAKEDVALLSLAYKPTGK